MGERKSNEQEGADSRKLGRSMKVQVLSAQRPREGIWDLHWIHQADRRCATHSTLDLWCVDCLLVMKGRISIFREGELGASVLRSQW